MLMKKMKQLLLLMISMVMFMGTSFAVVGTAKTEYKKYSLESVNLADNTEYFGSHVGKVECKEFIISKKTDLYINKKRYNSFENYLSSLGYLDYKNVDEIMLDNNIEIGIKIRLITETMSDC